MPDLQWLEELYRGHRRPLFLIAWNVLRCQGLAEDAVHTVFGRLAGLPKAPRDAKLYAYRAVRNAAVDLARIRGRYPSETAGSLETYPKLDVPAIDNEALVEAQAALEQLDDAAREVIELRLYASLTFQEIAELLDQPLPSVASRYRRAIEKVRELMEICHE